MGKRSFSIILGLALVAGLFSAVPARAQETPTVPDVVNIEDPYGDANTLGGDQVTPADGGSVSDIGKVWFTHDATNLNVHFLTEGPRGVNTSGLQFVLTAGEGGCLVIDGISTGTTYQSPDLGRVQDNCNGLDRVEGTFTAGALDTNGLFTVTVPRSYSPLFADGSAITAPTAQSWIFVGNQAIADATAGTPQPTRGLRSEVDDTKVGTDYAITGGDDVVVEEPTKPGKKAGKNDPPGKGGKKGCAKGKGKKKGACPGKKTPKPPKPTTPSDECAAFVPSEDGAEAEVSVVTDAATEAAPVVAEYTAEPGGPSSPLVALFDLRSFVFHNIQVNSSNPEAGLYVKIEFTENHDYDLALFHPDGTEAASSGESQPEPGLGAGSPEGAWEGGSNYEFLKGINTADCTGYTARAAGYLTTGGPVKISMWLGDYVADPAAPGGGE